jgi:hypothetical protein
MLYTIYQVTHKESGKCYIGKHQTRDPNDGYMGSGQLIRRAVKKHGVEAFRKEVLHVFETESEMNAKEAELITEEFCARDDTYNLCPGGQGGWGYVNKTVWSEDLRRAHNARVSGVREFTTEQRSKFGSLGIGMSSSNWKTVNEKSGNIWSGRNHSNDTKIKMSISHHGKHDGIRNSQFGTMWVTDGERSIKIDRESPIPNGFQRGRITRTKHEAV